MIDINTTLRDFSIALLLFIVFRIEPSVEGMWLAGIGCIFFIAFTFIDLFTLKKNKDKK